MRFIELTSDNTGRTIYVRADYIGVVSAYVNDDTRFPRVMICLRPSTKSAALINH